MSETATLPTPTPKPKKIEAADMLVWLTSHFDLIGNAGQPTKTHSMFFDDFDITMLKAIFELIKFVDFNKAKIKDATRPTRRRV